MWSLAMAQMFQDLTKSRHSQLHYALRFQIQNAQLSEAHSFKYEHDMHDVDN